MVVEDGLISEQEAIFTRLVNDHPVYFCSTQVLRVINDVIVRIVALGQAIVRNLFLYEQLFAFSEEPKMCIL